MTKLKAKKLITEWQQRLRLMDWIVNTKFLPIERLPDKLAESSISSDRKVCRLFFRWPHTTNYGEEESIESTIIHELLHCHLEPFYPVNPEKNKARVILLEQAVDLIAEALYTAKYNKDIK